MEPPPSEPGKREATGFPITSCMDHEIRRPGPATTARWSWLQLSRAAPAAIQRTHEPGPPALPRTIFTSEFFRFLPVVLALHAVEYSPFLHFQF